MMFPYERGASAERCRGPFVPRRHRRLLRPVSPRPHAVTQIGTIAFAYGLRQWLGARYGARFAAA
jgi:hypothetical protein